MANFSLEGFADQGVVTNGLVQPIAFDFLPDGRMLLLEKNGIMSIVDTSSGTISEYLDISSIVNDGQERGLLDIAIDPDFNPDDPNPDYIYLFYTRSADTDSAVIGRFEHQENSGGLTSTADFNSETVLWTDTDGFPRCCHYGGGLDFGPDGKLWLTTADKFESTNNNEGPSGGTDPQVDLESTGGKIIRINKDGSIPDGTDGFPANPYVDGIIDGPYPSEGVTPDPSIWAYGLRNPFRAEWDLENELFYIGEVGGNQNNINGNPAADSTDDIHIASLDQPGVFYGWHFYEGVNNLEVFNANSVFDPDDFPQPDTDLADPANGDYFSAPIFDQPHHSLTGGFVYRGDMFPDAFNGVYFYGDYETNDIKFLELSEDGRTALSDNDFKPSGEIPGDATNVVFLGQGPDGALYYINYAGNGGQLRRIVFEGNEAPSIDTVNITDNQGDANDLVGDPPLAVTFNFTVSDEDNTNSELSYQIVFGDGTSETGTPDSNGNITTTHQYTTDGFYTASLSVSDGLITTFSQPIAVTVGDPNDAPVVDELSEDQFTASGTSVTLTAKVSDPDTNDTPDSLSITWFFGDGNSSEPLTPDANGNVSVSHIYTEDGAYTAFFEVTDDEGATTRSDSIRVQVGEATLVPVADGLVFAIEAFIKVSQDNGAVVEVLDSSGFGNHVVGVGDPALLENATPTGQPAIVFDGDGDYLEREDTLNNFSSGSEPRTMFFVVDYDQPQAQFAGLAYGNDATNQAFGLTLNGAGGNAAIQGWSNDDISTFDAVTPGFISHAIVLETDGTYKHYVNGNQIDSGNQSDIAFNTVLDRLAIGQNLREAEGREEPMKVAAAYIWNRALSETEFNAVESFIQTTFISGEATNQAPTALNDSYSINENETLTTTEANSLLSNDNDSDGPQAMTITQINAVDIVNDGQVITLPNGELTINTNGTFSFIPDNGFTGTQTFNYTVSDGDKDTTATVSISVADPNPDNVPVTDGLVGYFESDQNVIATGTNVEEWLDGSGVGMDLEASGAPQFISGATPTGQAAISFDGIDDNLIRSVEDGDALPFLPSENDPRTLFIVVDYKASNGTFGGVAFGNGAPNQAFGLTLNGNSNELTVQGWGGANDYPSGVDGLGNNDGSAGDDWFVHSVVFDGSTITHYRDGIQIDSDAHTYNTIIEKFVIGEEINNSGFSALDVSAVLVYDQALTSAEHQQVNDYLYDKYIETTVGGNQAPTVTLENIITNLDDTTDTVNALKVADIVIADDGEGTNILSLVGEDAVLFEIIGTELFLKAGTTLDAESNAQLDVTVQVDDTTVGATPDDTAALSITVKSDDTGGGTPSDNPVTNGLIAAFEADNGVNTIGDGNTTLTSWDDSSGSLKAYDLTGVSGDPQLVANGTPTGQAAVAFDGAGDFLRIVGEGAVSGLPEGGEARTIFFVTDYKTAGEFTGIMYGESSNGEAFGLVTGANENLTIEGWGGAASQDSNVEGVNSLGWMVQSVVLNPDGSFKHYIFTQENGLQLIDSGDSSIFNTDIMQQGGDTKIPALAIAGKVDGNSAGEMDVAAALIYNTALSTGSDDLGGDHAAVSQYLYNKYIEAPIGDNQAPTVTLENVTANLDETTDITNALKVADIVVSDDGEGGPNTLSLIGDDAALFEITGTELLLKAGTILNAENNAQLDVTVQVDDATVGATPDDSASLSITVEGDDLTLPLDIPVTDDLVLLLESDVGVQALGEDVSGWEDQSNSEYDLISVGGDPKIGLVTTPTGEAAISFDGTGDFLERTGAENLTSLPDGAEARTMFFVVEYKTQGEFAGLAYGDNQTNQAFGLVANTAEQLALQAWGGSNDQSSTTLGVDIGFLVHSVVLDDQGNFTHYLHTENGPIVIDSGVQIFATDLTRLIIGGELGDNAQGEMNVAAAVIYNSALDSQDHNDVSTYLYEKYIATLSENTAPVVENQTFAVDENSPLNTIVGAVVASDPENDAPLTFTEAGGTGSAYFDITADGSIVVSDPTGLDFETAQSLTLEVSVSDPGNLTDTATITIDLNDLNAAPTVALTSVVTNLSEAADTSTRTKVADIVVSDDGEGGPNTLSLIGDDAALFEIDGTELFLKAGVTLDFETNPSLDVTVQVDDTTVGSTPDDSTNLSITVSDVNEDPDPDPTSNFILNLVDTQADIDIAEISEGSETNPGDIPANLRSITAAYIGDGQAESIELMLFDENGNLLKTQTENFAPYALFGDFNGNYNNSNPALADGNYSIKVTAYSGNNKNGTVLGSETISFAIGENVPIDPKLTISLNSTSITENGGSTSGTITRNGDLAAALLVTLASSDNSEATVPITVEIPAGQASAPFTVTAVDDTLLDGTQTSTLTASAVGFDDISVTVEVTDDEVPLVLGLSIDPASISENGSATTGTVTRNGDTSEALTVTLLSSDTSEATVPISVEIPVGKASATFTITPVDDNLVDGTQGATITASALDYNSATASVSINDDEASISNFTLTLVDTNSDTDIAGIIDGLTTDPGDTPANERSIIAEFNGEGQVESMSFMLFDENDNLLKTQTENVAPYAVFGDISGDYINPNPGLGDGNYSLKITAYSGNNASGAILGEDTISFDIASEAPLNIVQTEDGLLNVQFDSFNFASVSVPTSQSEDFYVNSIAESHDDELDCIYSSETDFQSLDEDGLDAPIQPQISQNVDEWII